MARQKSKFESVLFVRLKTETKEALQRHADRFGVDLSVVARWALEEYIGEAKETAEK